MTTRALSLVAGLLVLLGSAGLPGALLADRCPCNDLVLPYFEVQLVEEGVNPYDKQTTLFSVGNCGEESMIVQLTVWSNWAQPVLVTRVEVGDKAVAPLNLRDWLMFGRLPDRQLAPEELAHVQAALTGEPSPVNGLYYGTPVAPKLAVGFVTVEPDRAQWGDASDLWGDFFTVDPSRDFAAGESLVRMVGDPSREVCERHLLRFLETGEVERVGGIATELVFWTGIGGPPSPTPHERFSRMLAVCQVYDQSGLELGTWELPLLATQAIPVRELGWPTQFGWVDCVTPASTFTCMHFAAEGRYTMTLRSFCEESEAEPPEPREPAGLRLEKATEGFDADQPPGPELVVGEPVEWTYEVTNTGHVPLHAIVLEDDQLGDVDCPEDTLAAGASMICTATGVVEEGPYRNLATVTGRTPRGREIEASDPSHYTGAGEVPPPETSVDLEKSTLGEDADEPPGPGVPVGAPVEWTYRVTNTGDTLLTHIVVSDDQGVAVTCPRMDLGPGEFFLCTGSGVATAGQYANVGTVTALGEDGEEVSDSDPSHYFADEEPPPVVSVDVEKATMGDDADDPSGPTLTVGDPVTWTYVVTNTGDTPLTGVTVVDDQGVVVTCPKSELAPGESMTCTGTGVAVAGQYVNLATVTATGPEAVEATDSDPSHYYGEEEPPPGDEGCTPGYWKNHPASWELTGYSPSQSVESVFAQAGSYPALGAATLLEALDFGGGPGVEGAAAILLRAGVAAVLNAASPDVAYPMTVGQVIAQVDTALASGDRDTMLLVAAELDALNNLGCPL